jgi:8-hydroxy-5-deazaflavin:NADPH oxidoreductase
VNFKAWWPPRRRTSAELPPPIAEAGKPTIALIGGTGALGSGLARRWASTGYPVVIGSREAGKAQAVAATFDGRGGEPSPSGAGNLEAAALADIVVLAVPFASQQEILEVIRPNLRGKLVLTSAVPLSPEAVGRVPAPGTPCAAVELQRGLGASARVVSAFHNVSARRLGGRERIDCDVLVFGDDPGDRETVIGLVAAAGMRGLHGGPLANSAAAEALTSVLIGIGRHYKIEGPSIRITGLD